MLVHCVNTNGNMFILVIPYYQTSAHHYIFGRDWTDLLSSTHIAPKKVLLIKLEG